MDAEYLDFFHQSAAKARAIARVAAEVMPSTPADGDMQNVEAPRDTPAPKAFVSWAHADSSWSSERVQEWERSVVTFTTTLRQAAGIDADVDLYHFADQQIDWTRYGPSRIEEYEFILVILSKPWADRWSGKNRPGEGAGAVGEADALRGLFTRDQAEWQRRVKLIELPGSSDAEVPIDLARVSRFRVNPDDLDSYDDLIRTLTAQPLYVAPPLSSAPVLPPAVLRSAERTSTGKIRRGKDDRQMLRAKLADVAEELRIAEATDDLTDINNLRHQQNVLQGLLDALAAD